MMELGGRGARLFDGLDPSTGPTTSPESLAVALEDLARIGATGTQLTPNGWDVVMNGRVAAGRLARYRKVCRLRASHTLHAPISELNLMAGPGPGLPGAAVPVLAGSGATVGVAP